LCISLGDIDGFTERVFCLCGFSLCNADFDGERLKPDGRHHGECPDGIRGVAVERFRLRQFGNGDAKRRQCICYHYICALEVGCDERCERQRECELDGCHFTDICDGNGDGVSGTYDGKCGSRPDEVRQRIVHAGGQHGHNGHGCLESGEWYGDDHDIIISDIGSDGCYCRRKCDASLDDQQWRVYGINRRCSIDEQYGTYGVDQSVGTFDRLRWQPVAYGEWCEHLQLVSFDRSECDDGFDSNGQPGHDHHLHGNGYGSEWLPGYRNGNSDGSGTTDHYIDGFTECVFCLCGNCLCNTDPDGERLEPDGEHHGECPNGLRGVAVERFRLQQFGNGNAKRGQCICYHYICTLEVGCDEWCKW
jgi:hypothetical protein